MTIRPAAPAEESHAQALAKSPARSARTVAQYAAYIAIVQTSEELQRDFAELLREYDLTATQYNVLRILRGAPAEGLTCGDVAGRLIRHDPDVTRLLDRLEGRGLIERARDMKDRRVVRTRITEAGLAILADLDQPVDAIHEQQFGHLSEGQLADIVSRLEEAREPKP